LEKETLNLLTCDEIDVEPKLFAVCEGVDTAEHMHLASGKGMT
jgi:hypothetical protein